MDQPMTRRMLMDMSIENGKLLQKNMTAMIAIQSRKGKVDYSLTLELQALSSVLFKAQTGRIPESDFFSVFNEAYKIAEIVHDYNQEAWLGEVFP